MVIFADTVTDLRDSLVFGSLPSSAYGDVVTPLRACPACFRFNRYRCHRMVLFADSVLQSSSYTERIMTQKRSVIVNSMCSFSKRKEGPSLQNETSMQS